VWYTAPQKFGTVPQVGLPLGPPFFLAPGSLAHKAWSRPGTVPNASMLNDSQQLEKLRALIGPVCAAHGLELCDARFVTDHGPVLRVLIERPNDPSGGAGVSLADCQAVSRDLSTVLDVEDASLPHGRYRLEVGSPGLDRPLFSQRDYERFAGREINVRTSRPVDGRRRFSGVLRGLDGDGIKLDVGGQELVVPLTEIEKANLVFRP
jgi:ribosome maturation factor RimP